MTAAHPAPRTLILSLLATLIVGLALGLTGGWWARAATTPAPPAPGPVDIGFAQSMTLHHQQAITMAQLMLDGRPTPLESLARNIAYAQLLELGEMRGWLRLWEQPLQRPARDMDWMLQGVTPPDEALLQYLLECRNTPTGMAGLASDTDVLQLRHLDGRARDQWFLTLLLAHHQGGIPMARFAAAEARLPATRALATRIALEQAQEMQRMLMTLEVIGRLAETAD